MQHPGKIPLFPFIILLPLACQEFGLPSSSPDYGGLLISPDSIDFGNVKVGERVEEELEFTNATEETVMITSGTISFDSDSQRGDFFFSESVRFPVKLDPSSSEKLVILFSPSDEGLYSGETLLKIGGGEEVKIPLSGKGYTEGGGTYPDISVAPTDLDFGDVYTGDTSTLSFNISNIGDEVLSVDGLSMTGSSVFSFPSTFSSPFDMDPGDGIDVEVSFTPLDVLSYSAKITVTSSDPDEGVVEVALSGNGVEEPCPTCTPDIYVDTGSILGPLSLVFITLSGTTDSQTFAIHNVGTGDLNVSRIEEGFLNSPEFSITLNPAPTTIPPGGSSMVTITYSPLDTVPDIPYALLDMNLIHIYHDDYDENPLDIELWGTAI